MVNNLYEFDPYPISITMKRLASNVRSRRLERNLSLRQLSLMSGVPLGTIQRFEQKCAISLESYVKIAKALGYSEDIMQLLSQPKYKTMQELIAINNNKNRKRGRDGKVE